MTREVIAVDIDDVLSSQTQVWMHHHNEVHGTSLTIDDFQVPGEYWGYFEDVLERNGVSKAEAAARFERFLEDKLPLRQVIDPDAFPVLRSLKQTYRLEIVTSRGSDWAEVTRGWLKEKAPDIFDDIHFVELWPNNGEKVTKAQICRSIGAGYLIDDNAEHCNLAALAGLRALLFGNFGWNIDAKLEPGVVRVDDWAAVKQYFREYGQLR